MPTPTITQGQIAIDPSNGVLYYKNNSGTLINTSLNWSQPTDSLIQTQDSVQISSDIVISGNLTVNGTTVTVNTETVVVEDNIIVLNANISKANIPNTLNSGIEVERGSLTNVELRWNESVDRWQFTNDGTNYYDIGSVEGLVIEDLSDVVLSNASNGQYLRYNGSAWVNDVINLGTDTEGSYVQSLTAGTGVFLANNSGETATPTISIGQDVSSSANVSFNTVTANFVGNITGNVSSISTHNIEELADVVITSAQNGQLLQYNGSAWVNNVMPSAEPIGHEDKSQSTISFNESNRQFSIAPVSGSYSVWCKGIKYVKTTTETISIPDTSGLYYIYFSNTGVLSYKTTYFDWENDTPTAYIYWNEVDNKAYFFADERHGITLDWATHEYLHRTRGAAIANGFGVSSYSIDGDGSSDDHAKFDLAGGTFFDEDLQVDITHSATPTANTWEQVLEGNAEIPVFYKVNTHWVKDAATEFAFKQGTSRPQYNLYSAPNWSAVDIGNNKFAISWIIATNNLNEPVIAIMGQASYNNIGEAEAAVWEDLNLDGFPIFEFRPLHKVVFQGTDSFTNSVNSAICGIYDLRRVSSGGDAIASTPVSDHGSMTGLSDDDHTQYLNTDRHDIHDHSIALGTASINDLSDVTITMANDGDFLRYSSSASAWINDPVNLATDTVGNYVQSLTAGTGITLTNATAAEGGTPTIAVTTNTFDAYGAAAAAQAAAEASAATAISNHESDTTNVHGIANTALLSTLVDLSNHATSTNVHGISNTAELVTLTGNQTLTNKTLTSPSITGISPTITLDGDLSGSATLTNLSNATLTASIASTFEYIEDITAGTNIILIDNSIGINSTHAYSISTSATPNFTSVSTASLSIDGIEIDPTGVINGQILKYNSTLNKFIASDDLAESAQAGAVTKYTEVFYGNGTLKTIIANHNLNSTNVIVQIIDTSSKDTIEGHVTRTGVNSVTATFQTPIPNDGYTVIVIG